MNAELLLEHFHRLGDAPDAVLRLRRFMLEMAVSGKFLPAESQTNWPSKTLGQLCDLKGGLWTGKKPPYTTAKVLRVTNITKDSTMNVENAIELDVETKQLATRRLEPGDIIIEKSGGGDNQPVGRVALFQEKEGIYSYSNFTTAMRVIDKTLIEPQYLHHFLRSFYFKGGTIPLQNNATNLRNLQLGEYKEIDVPLPPLAEQQRIVAKVDELMALCDTLEAAQQEREQQRTRLTSASWQALTPAHSPGQAEVDITDAARFALEQLHALTTRPEQVKSLRQTILDLAVRGKLVEQDEKDEPASVLLKKIAVEKARLVKEGILKRTNEIIAIDPDDVTLTIPNSWDWVRLGDLLLGDSQNGFSKKPDDAPDGTPILRISAGTVRNDGIVAEEEHKLIGGITSKQREQYGLIPGDLLACRFNGNKGFVGRLTLYRDYLNLDPIYPDKLIRLRLLKDFVDPSLVRIFGSCDVIRKEIEDLCATTVGNWGVSAKNLKEVRIPLPPLAEQGRIVAKVEALMALCDGLEAALREGEEVKGKALEAVLQHQLTPTLKTYKTPNETLRMATEQ